MNEDLNEQGLVGQSNECADENRSVFIDEFKKSFESETLARMLFSKPTANAQVLARVQIRPVLIKQEKKVSFVFEYPTKQITKNYSLHEAVKQVDDLLKTGFKNAFLCTNNQEIRLSYNKKMSSRLDYAKVVCPIPITTEHDRVKQRMIEPENNPYLKELGVVGQNNLVFKHMQSKYKQINKYIETIDAIIKNSGLSKKEIIKIADMGSGKGYLTFAMYDYFCNHLKVQANITGVEIRQELVALCNAIAEKFDYKNLRFCQGDIQSYDAEGTDILIALHACDTATDDAIYKGIVANSAIIITAPCCHKQIRKEFFVENDLQSIVKYGILEERQAEIVTDTLRALVLEAWGYKTNIFEYIADAHTHKNVMIVGVKKKAVVNQAQFVSKITNLKNMFGIQDFYLENLLKSTPLL